MYVLVDTFNNTVISRHRTVKTAAKGMAKFFRQFYRNNTSSSYLPVSLMVEDKDGLLTAVSDEEEKQFDRYCMTSRG